MRHPIITNPQPTRRKFHLSTIATAASAGLLLGAVISPAAHAAAPLSCAGTETLTFQPPLTNTPTPTQVHFAIDLTLCLTGGITSGSSDGNFQTTASCTTVNVLPPAFTDTYQWNTRASSTVNYTAPVETVVNGSVVVTDTGNVTSGLDNGAVANETTILPEPGLLACATTGVAQLIGPYTLTFG